MLFYHGDLQELQSTFRGTALLESSIQAGRSSVAIAPLKTFRLLPAVSLPPSLYHPNFQILSISSIIRCGELLSHTCETSHRSCHISALQGIPSKNVPLSPSLVVSAASSCLLELSYQPKKPVLLILSVSQPMHKVLIKVLGVGTTYDWIPRV